MLLSPLPGVDRDQLLGYSKKSPEMLPIFAPAAISTGTTSSGRTTPGRS